MRRPILALVEQFLEDLMECYDDDEIMSITSYLPSHSYCSIFLIKKLLFELQSDKMEHNRSDTVAVSYDDLVAGGVSQSQQIVQAGVNRNRKRTTVIESDELEMSFTKKRTLKGDRLVENQMEGSQEKETGSVEQPVKKAEEMKQITDLALRDMKLNGILNVASSNSMQGKSKFII